MEKQVMGMDYTKNGISKYQSNNLLTRPPELLVLDLYDGAARFITLSLEGFSEESYEKIGTNISKAGAIIDELSSTLNFEKGGEIAVNFSKLYGFIRTQLTAGLFKKDRKAVEDALRIVQDMRDAWSDGVVKNRV